MLFKYMYVNIYVIIVFLKFNILKSNILCFNNNKTGCILRPMHTVAIQLYLEVPKFF